MLSDDIRKIIINQSKRANVGHIGSALSIADILVALYKNILNISDPKDPERDRFILSKGHAALALYAIFRAKGWISQSDLDTYCSNHSYLGVHPEHFLKGVDFSTGSLGQGLSLGVGATLAAKLQKSKRRVYVLISDAECNEGSIWEAAMFATHHQLENLTLIIDDNKQQALGYTKDILHITPLVERFRSFGWDAIEADGHDIHKLSNILKDFNYNNKKPHVVVAQTIFGKGVSFMENKIAWHYLPLTDMQYKTAIDEIQGALP